MKKKRSLPFVIITTVILTAVVVLVAMNLMGGEKKIRWEPRHEYGVDDPQFLRSMGVLLGPTLVTGNKVETLLNGDEIFPAMLSAIRLRRAHHLRGMGGASVDREALGAHPRPGQPPTLGAE